MSATPKILVVDDNEANLFIIQKILEGQYELVCVQSGEEALTVAQSLQPELVILDVVLPGIDGYETCRRLRSDKHLRHCKILMVSAMTLVSERLKGYAAGADDYITKPFNEDELQAKVNVYGQLYSTEEVSQLRNTLLMLISHEMRTPLNGILPVTEMLKESPNMTWEEQLSLFDLIEESAHRLHQFVEKCLKLSALTSDQKTMAFRSESSRTLIDTVCQRLTAKTQEKQICLQVDNESDFNLQLDKHEIVWVIEAILDNAIRYSPKGGDIYLTCTCRDGLAVVEVVDHGKGFDNTFLSHVFNSFYSSDILHHTEGHGLSLAIAYQIVRSHGGQLIARNNADTCGATLTLRLPLNPVDDEAACASQEPAKLTAGVEG